MPVDTRALEEEFLTLIEADAEMALQLITGMFVGLTVEYTRRRGHEPSGDLRIVAPGQREITIHATQSSCNEELRHEG